MLRSFIDARIDEALALCRRHGYALPPFARWSPQEAVRHPAALEAMASGGLGWNVVEFGSGTFARSGLVVFTSRMGPAADLTGGGGRLYAEKILVAQDGQVTPHHYHVVKTEDIVNRGGARFVVELVAVDREGRPTDAPIRVRKDVEMLEVPPRGRVALEPGESIVLEPFVAHAFWAEGGAVLGGEVSLVNDDATDNYFVPALAPMDPVVEDEPARFVTVGDLAALQARAATLARS
ncbi:MAG: D-lyxose/D-mannose family sugar isomerase [Alsobacter sp.]